MMDMKMRNTVASSASARFSSPPGGSRYFAQQVGPQTGFSIEKATAGLWGLFERGDLRLVASDDGGLTVETCGENRAKRRVQARKNWRLVEFKRQMARGVQASQEGEVAAASE
jgi:hypothetical protein